MCLVYRLYTYKLAVFMFLVCSKNSILYNNDSSQIHTVKSAKYFKSKFKHIKVLECKIAHSFGIITKLKTILSKQNLFQLYYTLVHSHLTYGITISSSIYPSHLQKLQVLQNKAAEAICNAPY